MGALHRKSSTLPPIVNLAVWRESGSEACVSVVLVVRKLTLVINAPILIQVGNGQQLLQLLLVQGLPNHFHGGLQLVSRYKAIAIAIEYSAKCKKKED